MPELEFAFLADHVRSDGGLGHALGIGIDRVVAPDVPTGQNVGLLGRIAFAADEARVPHRVEVVAVDADGQRLVAIEHEIGAAGSGPDAEAFSAMFALNIGVPLPRYGYYTIDIVIDGAQAKQLELLVEPPPA
jgi:hypothetical protein